MKRLLSAILILSILAALSGMLISCDEEKAAPSAPAENWEYTYNPYDNRFKDPIDTGAEIKISGKSYYFSEIDIRDKDEIKNTTMENELAKIYMGMFVSFTAEDTVEIVDYTHTFNVPETKGERIGNVLTVSVTNKTGSYTYPIRFEIHDDYILVIHNGHTYHTPGLYSTIKFTAEE